MRFFVDPKLPFKLLQLDGVNSMIVSSPWLVSALHRTKLAKRHDYILKEKSQPPQTPLQNWNGSKIGINSNMHVMWLSTWVYAKLKPCAFWGGVEMLSFKAKFGSTFVCVENKCFVWRRCHLFWLGMRFASHRIAFDSRVAQKYTRSWKSLQPSEFRWTVHFLAIKNSSWWFQPLWKTLVMLDHLPNFRSENKNYLKPPTRKPSSKQPSICGDKAAKCITSGRNARPKVVFSKSQAHRWHHGWRSPWVSIGFLHSLQLTARTWKLMVGIQS